MPQSPPKSLSIQMPTLARHRTLCQLESNLSAISHFWIELKNYLLLSFRKSRFNALFIKVKVIVQISCSVAPLLHQALVQIS